MIDPKLFTVESLLAALLDSQHGNWHHWRRNARIDPTYVNAVTLKQICVVRYADQFLRHSGGPRQGHFWDFYPDDYQTPDVALIGLLEAPPPPRLFVADVWKDEPT
jgi:hypothetical protein